MLTHQEIIFRLCASALLGGIVGLERERLEWAAGLRTHMLVCLGATLLMIVSAFGFADILGTGNVVLDPSRVAAQVVSGIGFLGAGTILFLRQEVIRGLTAAASLWTVVAVGSGLYFAAAFATAVILIILAIVKPLEKRLFRRGGGRQVAMRLDRRLASLTQIGVVIETAGVSVQEFNLKKGGDPAEDRLRVQWERNIEKRNLLTVVEALPGLDGVLEVTW